MYINKQSIKYHLFLQNNLIYVFITYEETCSVLYKKCMQYNFKSLKLFNWSIIMKQLID